MKQLPLFPNKQYVVRFTTTDNKGNPRLCGSQAYDSYREAYQRLYTLWGNAFILEDSVTIHADNYWVGH
jgi:hypothetical protein